MPAMPTRITSLAPSTRPEDLVPAMVKRGKAAPAAAARFRKLRRVIMKEPSIWRPGDLHKSMHGHARVHTLSSTLSPTLSKRSGKGMDRPGADRTRDKAVDKLSLLPARVIQVIEI